MGIRDHENPNQKAKLSFKNPSYINILGIAFALAALFTILISLILSFFITDIIKYNLYVLLGFIVLTIIFKFSLSKYLYEKKEHYFGYYSLIDEFKNDTSSKMNRILALLVFLMTLFGSIYFHNFKFFLEFGIMLGIMFLGLSMFSSNIQRSKLPFPPLPIKLPGNTDEETMERNYSWVHNTMNEKSFSISVTIDIKTLRCARSKPRIKLFKKEDILKWVVYPEAITEEVKEAAAKLREISNRNGFYKIEEITNVLSMVQQSIPYSLDKDTAPNHEEEYPRYPIETLYDKTGDCECKTFLACALLTTLGYDVAFFSLPGHVALGIAANPRIHGYFQRHNDKRYYYYETTAKGWKFGQVPAEERGKIEFVVPVKFKSKHDLSDCIKESIVEKGGAKHK